MTTTTPPPAPPPAARPGTDVGPTSGPGPDAPPDLAFTTRLPRRRVRVPTVLQMEITECGAAALAMMLAHFGRWVSLEDLRRDCGVSRNGANAKRLVQAARVHGLEAKGVSIELDRLPEQQFPCIAYWDFAHFVAVEGTSRRGVHINDPARGRVLVPWADADRSFTGLVLRMAPGPDFVRDGRPRRALPLVRDRLTGLGPGLVYLLVAGVTLAVPIVLGPLALQAFVQQYLLGGLRSWGVIALAVIGLAAVLDIWLSAWQGIVARRVAQAMTAREGLTLVDRALRLPVGFYLQRYAGEVATRLQLVDAVARVVTQTVLPATFGLITSLAVAVALAVFAWPLAAIATAAAVVTLLTLRVVQSTRVDQAGRLAQEQAAMNATVTYALASIDTIKATGSEDATLRSVLGAHAQVANATADLQRSSAFVGVLPTLVTGAAGALVVGVGGVLVGNGAITTATYIAVLALVPVFLRPVALWSAAVDTLQQAQVWLGRLDDLLRQPPDVPGTLVPAADAQLVLRDVTFRYDAAGPAAVEGLSLTVAPGRRVALVGVSGSGKSTAARLAAGLLAPSHGQVLLGDTPVTACDPAERARALGYVEQEVVLFAGTIRDNITLFDDRVPTADVVAAARAAAIDADIESRPGGLDAPVADGGRNLSGGQRQRLEIARVMARAPGLVILDEATSALDPLVEEQVMDALVASGAGLLIVAHRLSTVRDCDEIVVLDHGRVVERGTHAELIDVGGVYAELVHQ